MTFKAEILEIARSVAAEKPDWAVNSSGDFVSKRLKHTDLIVSPGFTFNAAPSCVVQPFSAIRNKKIVRLCKAILGFDPFWTLSIKFQLESERYRGPESVSNIYPAKVPFTTVHGERATWPRSFITKDETPDYLRNVLADGIAFIDEYFDLQSEESLLRHLPVNYRWMDQGIGNSGRMGSFYEQADGIIHCLAAIVIGDFGFVERYQSDDIKTSMPKREKDLEKIRNALPELRRRYEATGSVV
jgi:hypothetical protein